LARLAELIDVRCLIAASCRTLRDDARRAVFESRARRSNGR
jgi:hypothetical protein